MLKTVLNESNIVSLIPTTLRDAGPYKVWKWDLGKLGNLSKIIEPINLYKNKIGIQ